MKLGVITTLFRDKSLKQTLNIVSNLGIKAVKIGTGGYIGDAHCRPNELLQNKEALKRFKTSIQEKNLIISALSCHGNPLHPDPEVSGSHHDVFRKTVLLAQKVGVDRVITFSGCPGGSNSDRTPNWITCPWPGFTEILTWQWEKKLIPYWKDQADFAR